MKILYISNKARICATLSCHLETSHCKLGFSTDMCKTRTQLWLHMYWKMRVKSANPVKVRKLRNSGRKGQTS